MIDFDILKKMGSTPERIKEVFTSDTKCRDSEDKSRHSDHDNRKRMELLIESRIQSGISAGLRNYKIYAAVDLAWDSAPLTPEVVPLMAYAQGKLDFGKLKTQLKGMDQNLVRKFATFDSKTNEIKSVDVQKFLEVNVNLVRSFITRRTATLAVKYTKLFPFFKYEAVGTSFVAKLRGDVLSQRIEMMTAQYGYRHDLVQAVRDELLYGHCLEFVDGAWDVEKQIVKKRQAEGFDTSEDKDFQVETKIVREGNRFKRPHPTRVFADNSAPISAINTDTGPEYMGFWNICRFGEVHRNTAYFNRDAIAYTSSLLPMIAGNTAYFELYSADAPVNFPTWNADQDPASKNDREANVGLYSGEEVDKSLALVDYFAKIVPKDYGIGDYPFPVWMRLVVANGTTVIFGEFLPDVPAIYYGYNESDSRLVNISFGHEILPLQDQMSNMLNQLLFTQRSGLIKVLCANLDLLTADQIAEFRAILKGDRYTAGPILVEFNGSALQDTNLDIDDVFKLHEANMLGDVSTFFSSISRLMELAERILNISSQELAQSERREISATQTVEIANSTNTVLAYLGLGIDEAMSAKKRLLYNSLIAKGESLVFVPVVNRYTDATVEAAGFEVFKDGESEDDENYADVTEDKPRAQTVTGTKFNLIYDYNFTSRDGSERAVDSKAAEVMVNLLAQLVQIPNLLQDWGKPRLYAFINAIVRSSGAGVDINLTMDEGENPEVSTGDPATDSKKAIEGAISQIVGAVEKNTQQIAAIQAQLGSAPPITAPAPVPQMPPAPADAPPIPAPV